MAVGGVGHGIRRTGGLGDDPLNPDVGLELCPAVFSWKSNNRAAEWQESSLSVAKGGFMTFAAKKVEYYNATVGAQAGDAAQLLSAFAGVGVSLLEAGWSSLSSHGQGR